MPHVHWSAVQKELQRDIPSCLVSSRWCNQLILELYLIMWFQSHLSQQKHPHWQGPEETDPIVSDLPFLPHLGLITSSILPKTPPCTISETISSSPIFAVNNCQLNFTRELKSGRSLALLIRPALSLIQSCLCSSLSMSAEPKSVLHLYIYLCDGPLMDQ